MSQRTAVQAEKKGAMPLVSGRLRHAAVRSVPEHSIPPVAERVSSFGHDFSRVPARTMPTASQAERSAAYPVFPRTCPFGGACHTCPVQVQAKLKVGQPGDKYEGSGRDGPHYLFSVPQLSFRPQHLKLGEMIEEIGSAGCDPDTGKVEFWVNYKKLPLCMADCAYEHEKAHRDFMKAECAKVSAAVRAAEEAIKKAKKSRSEADVRKAEQATKDAEKAVKVYEKWVADNCRANEEQAYQAGIDVCKTAKARKQCADLKETERYKKIMKQWETFKKIPPNCLAPPKKAGTKKAGAPKKGEPKEPPEPERPPAK